jgi:biopolymer transport protein ExbD
MSHGSTERCEPNFTPLLDLVLQLVMFFMISANFVLEQTSVDIKLPKAIAAKALEKSEEEVIFLNVTEQGTVRLTPDQQEGDIVSLDNDIQVREFMGRQAEREKKRTAKDRPQATLILRVDQGTRFEKTYAIMRACRMAGYEKVQLRVERSTEG